MKVLTNEIQVELKNGNLGVVSYDKGSANWYYASEDGLVNTYDDYYFETASKCLVYVERYYDRENESAEELMQGRVMVDEDEQDEDDEKAFADYLENRKEIL